MPTIKGHIDIARPIDGVFDFVADETNEPRYNEEMVRCRRITPGSIGVGTRYDDEMKAMGTITPMTIEVTGIERPHRLASWSHLESIDICGALAFKPIEGGTRLSWE